MRFLPAVLALSLSFLPVAAYAQTAGISGSPLPDQPYTLIYPDVMVTSGEPGGPLTINHPGLPLQCVLTVVPVEDTGWTAEGALAELDAAAVAAGWSETFPGFTLGASLVTRYQSNPALQYEGTSTGSEQGPITLVHTETVDAGNGYTLDCFYATEMAAEARPVVDAIIANFSTRQDAQPVVTP
ncbi:hypothetical protein ASD04_17620 [Devosia sp. Root436]|uniref:hypothetical protein n=1 Tax=Devosia sp. Root436 TaxID=1736537 RepID=UPI0006F684F1|nr:hypothetical protein [Devosia sp. Root436]KQX34061.1 hypothetical protein ASD04_17620 [Devosia sp. Root436]